MMYKKRVVFWAACTGMLLFGICLITLGSVASDLREKLQLDEISSGTLFSILPIGILTGSLVFGPIVDKFGYKILLAISCVFMFAGFEGIAYAPSTGLLKICIYLIGFGGGAVNGATNALVADISDKDKGANLSLLGVFFGIGALGMPLILGILENRFSFEVIVAATGTLTLVAGLFFVLIKFPPPKQTRGFPITRNVTLIKDNVLILIAFFLFFQSGFEGIINNWTTTYLIKQQSVQQSNALYALSSFVAGMAVMRLLVGSLFRSVSVKKILIASFGLIILGLILLKAGNSFNMTVLGLVFLGAGLANGFPMMLGFVGDRYAELSGTAFSLVLFIALLGNTLINYGMGIIAQNFGIQHLITVAFAESIVMILLCLIILNKIKNNK
ncbi:MAG: MFS transporter [Bacteroidia bacterium]|nr:MFS transporter [Bacteroidia bacterium]